MKDEVTILLCGRDAGLLMTRELLLASAGYTVRRSVGCAGVIADGRAEKTDLIVICHTCMETESVEISMQTRAEIPVRKMLILESGQRRLLCVRPGVWCVDSLSPLCLLEAVRAVLDA